MRKLTILHPKHSILYSEDEKKFIELNNVECEDFEELLTKDEPAFDIELTKLINIHLLRYAKLRNLDYRKINKEKVRKIFENVKMNFPRKKLFNEIDLVIKIILNE